MPKIYAPPGKTTQDLGATFYQVFVGPHAAFEEHRGMYVADFPDAANTILIVEAGRAVPWTMPEDIHFAADQPVPKLGGLFPGIFNAAFADGSVWALPKRIDADTLRKLIMRNEGQSVDVRELRVLVNPREVNQRELNKHLKQEAEAVRKRVEDLRREKEILQELAKDAGTELLQEENQRLQETLRQSREELDRLDEEVQRLKRTLEKQLEQSEGK